MGPCDADTRWAHMRGRAWYRAATARTSAAIERGDTAETADTGGGSGSGRRADRHSETLADGAGAAREDRGEETDAEGGGQAARGAPPTLPADRHARRRKAAEELAARAGEWD
eukprot:2504707-Pleurochrysis_carterae.AAC.2